MDKIFFNGKIRTMEKGMPEAQAVAIKNGIIVRVGSNEQILALKSDKTELIDLEGKLMLPGFTDTHMHLLSYGYSLEKVNLYSANCMEDLIRLGKEFLADRPYLTWLQGRGWNTDGWEDPRFPNRYDLDKITTDIPMFYTRACGHIIIVNSKALEVMGVTKDTPQIPGGMFDLDENGEPLGIFREAARDLVYDALPKLSVEEIQRMLVAGAKKGLECGITAMHTDDFEALAVGEYPKILEAFWDLEKTGKLPVRVYEQCLLASKPILDQFLAEGHYTNEGTPMFRIGTLKLLADGSLGGRTAYLGKPYADDASSRGIPVFEQETLDYLIGTAHKAGLMCSVHCIGDGCMNMVLDSIEKAQLECPKPDMRHSIIHCQITDKPLLQRFVDLNVSAHVQPAFIDEDMYIVRDRVGAEMESTSYAWKTMKDMGIPVSGGSDSPVISFNVMEGIYCAVTRKDLKGNPEGGWLPDQKMSVEEAVYLYTMGGAYESYDEGVRGSIRNGKYADMVVLERNIFEIPAEEIKDVKVQMTVLNGDIVYQA